METQPDLDERVRILEEALIAYPHEPRLERLWGLVREKRNLVNSIVGLARLYEQGRQFGEALGQWQTLQIIYGEYPGLNSEIERLETLRDQEGVPETTDYRTNGSSDFQRSPGLSTRQAEGPDHGWERQGKSSQRLERQLPSYGSDQELARPPFPREEITNPTWSDFCQRHSDELALLEAESSTSDDPVALELILERIDSLEQQYRGEPQFQLWSERVRRRLSDAAKYLENSRRSGRRSTPTGKERSVAPEAASPLPSSTSAQDRGPSPVSVAVASRGRDNRGGHREKFSMWKRHPEWLFAGASTIIMLILATITGIVYTRSTPRNVARDITTAARKTEVVQQRIVPAVRLSTDLDSGKVWLDGTQVGELQQGQFLLGTIEPGQHTLKLAGRQVEVNVKFQQSAGEMPIVLDAITAKGVKAWAVSSAEGHAKVYSSAVPAKVVLDGQPVRQVGASGLELNGVSQGQHELIVGDGNTRQKRSIEIGSKSEVLIFLSSERDVGTLVVSTGEDGVRVAVNGKERGSTVDGHLRIPNLPIVAYTVQVSKQGFETAQQRVRLKKGEDTSVEFRMSGITASLLLEGAPVGARVLLDETLLGTVKADGTFIASNVSPGGHFVGLQLEGYRAARLWKNFEQGKSVHLSGKEATLEPNPGRLTVNVTPSTNNVRLRAIGDTTDKLIEVGVPISVAPGTYTVTARWEGGDEGTEIVRVLADADKAISLHALPTGMEGWDNPSGWMRDGAWSVRQGGGLVLFSKRPTVGVVQFTAALRKGHKLQWVAGLRDQYNYILYQLDEKSFRRIEIVKGKKSRESKTQHGMGKSHTCTVQVEIRRNAIVNQLYEKGIWGVLDAWSDADQDFGNGKFGFLIASDDVVGLTNFSFQPQ